MIRGRELPVDSPVRRRLFAEDDQPPQKKPMWSGEDYLSRIVKTEFVARNLKNHLIFKGMKWNFDFENEEPTNGPIQWYRKGNTEDWVGLRRSGRTIRMRYRDRDPESALESVYAEERCLNRRLSAHTVSQRRTFFNDGKFQEFAKVQGEDENFTNNFLAETQPIYNIHFRFDFDNRRPFPFSYPQCRCHGNTLMGYPRTLVIEPHHGPRIIDDMHSNSNSASSSTSNPNCLLESDPKDSDKVEEKDNQADRVDPFKDDKKKDLMDLLVFGEDAIFSDDVVITKTGIHTENMEEENENEIIVQESQEIGTEVEKDGNDNKDESSIPEGNFENLTISENMNTDMDVVQKKGPSSMQEKNETTPKN